MDGSTNSTVAGHDRLGRFTSGHNEYAARRRRVADRWQQLCADYDDLFSPIVVLSFPSFIVPTFC